jgi:hypothetical protein
VNIAPTLFLFLRQDNKKIGLVIFGLGLDLGIVLLLMVLAKEGNLAYSGMIQ